MVDITELTELYVGLLLTFGVAAGRPRPLRELTNSHRTLKRVCQTEKAMYWPDLRPKTMK
jgi:hypothetical protein